MLDDQWINTDPRTKKLLIRFRVRGFTKQFCLSTGLNDTKRNREIVRSKRDAIANDIALERFDSTLESYRFRAAGKIPAVAVTAIAPPNYDLQQLWELYTEFQSYQLEKTTILTGYRAISNYIRRLPTVCLEDASQIRGWVLENLTHYIAWDLLNNLNRCCEWAVSSGLISDNPFLKLKIKKPKNKSTNDDYKAFTLEQRDLIIEAFDQHPLYAYYSSLVRFLFWTGCRPGEAFALSWGDVSDDCCQITINKSCNGHRILKGTKNGKKRVFPCQSGSRLQNLLLAIRSQEKQPTDLVFLSKTGRPMTSGVMFTFWHESKSGSRENIYKYPGVVKSLADADKLPYLKPYATRHTFATWAISSGISPDKVALWIGDTVETVFKYYCHPEIVSAKCPDF
ncbi:tyrosine-type recombinase/integrase [Nostoc sp. ChiVER01]|uniref:tyrosine-type recombinase/integrase n=1 Tax=Nostoc sp. ChiVER01 TaxID=3075382 RepID=UPI002AD55733|nr:tyrosine-type recombinase/integrase [Nostoc sp. ChiVER01]MDZ8227551.1 tyrosine-type recombinase/integrase [Nostoc sp. ChiVER01]